MGETMSPKRTPAIGVGKTARLTVTLSAGKYHMWDPVTSSMSHAKFITVKAPANGLAAAVERRRRLRSGSGSGGAPVERRLRTGGGGTGGTMDPGMDGCDHM